MMRPDCERWADLSDRVAIEEPLTQEEQHFFETHPDECSACAAERTWWTELATLQTSDRDEEDPTVVVPDRGPLSVVPEARPIRRRTTAAIAVAAAGDIGAGAAAPSSVLLVPGRAIASIRARNATADPMAGSAKPPSRASVLFNRLLPGSS